MTVLPEPPSHLLTIAEYAALGETEPGHTELKEGRLAEPFPVRIQVDRLAEGG